MKSKLIHLLKAAVTLLLFCYLFGKVDFHQFGATLRNAKVDVLAAGFLILWIGHYVCIFRWRMLMRPLMPVLSLRSLFGIYCIGLFFNLTFPTVVGGDLVKMYYAGKPSKAYAESFAATFLDRDTGMFAMMIIACTAIVIHPVSVAGVHVSLIVWSVFFAFVAGNIALFTPSIHRLLTDSLRRLKLALLAKKLDTISKAFAVMGKQHSVLAASLLISLVNQLLVISVTWFIAIGLRIDAPLSYFFVFVPVITLISMIPVSLNGMGLREYAFMSLFGAIGVSPASCVALGLISSLVIVLSSIPGGVVYIFLRNRSDVQEMAAFETEFP